MLAAGLTFHVLTLVQNFYTPFVRDVLLQHGMADCAKQTCINILRKCAPALFTLRLPCLLRAVPPCLICLVINILQKCVPALITLSLHRPLRAH